MLDFKDNRIRILSAGHVSKLIQDSFIQFSFSSLQLGNDLADIILDFLLILGIL